MIKIYGGKMGSSFRAHWMLAEAGVEYETAPVDMAAKEHKGEAFLKLNPMGQVPVMVDGDFVLTESMAINEYIAAKYMPAFLGSTPEQKADAWRWSLWAYLNVQKHFGAMAFQALWAPEKNEEAFAKDAEAVKPYLAILDAHLAGKEYLLGKEFSTADINAGVAVIYGVMVAYDFSNYPNIAAWIDRLKSRPAYQKATA